MIRLTYDREVDALSIELVADALSARTVRVSDTVRADLDEQGRVVAFEILDAAAQLGRATVEQLPSAERWLTLEEAARESGRAASTLRVQLNAGRLEGEKRGRDWYVLHHQLLSYLESLSGRGRPLTQSSPSAPPSLREGTMPAKKTEKIYIEKRAQGDFAVRRAGSERASAVEPTQREAIARAREIAPGAAPHVERVRNTSGGKPDKWRKA